MEEINKSFYISLLSKIITKCLIYINKKGILKLFKNSFKQETQA